MTITEAALGGHVEVPTPDGPVIIEIPAGTQTGQRFRLRKRGLPRLGEHGPRRPLRRGAGVGAARCSDDESRELLREFARRNPDEPAPAGAARRPRAGQKGSLIDAARPPPARPSAAEPRPAPGQRQVLHDQRGGQELRHPPADPAPLRARGAARSRRARKATPASTPRTTSASSR